jgi:hypothetical protein
VGPASGRDQEKGGGREKKRAGRCERTQLSGSGFGAGLGLSPATVASAGDASAHDCRAGGLRVGVLSVLTFVVPLCGGAYINTCTFSCHFSCISVFVK